MNGSFEWIILLHEPNKNFLKTANYSLSNSILRNITLLGAYARQAILNDLIISLYFVHDKHF